eukprot:gnl/MRDRNA2_/MRDRNA2_164372_c0_seq1.p1 gnl/MRDRNA2_/MRDRNA2_164372_c0~~gnl/MRDRNA2_/MRDRNA2_164372_c0_seq1.p1  ORF type:complete len:270 (-),score=53.56 gnl/MRDRNA2_/MRDRNA2_164372_c0_seq1:2-811(-)
MPRICCGKRNLPSSPEPYAVEPHSPNGNQEQKLDQNGRLHSDHSAETEVDDGSTPGGKLVFDEQKSEELRQDASTLRLQPQNTDALSTHASHDGNARPAVVADILLEENEELRQELAAMKAQNENMHMILQAEREKADRGKHVEDFEEESYSQSCSESSGDIPLPAPRGQETYSETPRGQETYSENSDEIPLPAPREHVPSRDYKEAPEINAPIEQRSIDQESLSSRSTLSDRISSRREEFKSPATDRGRVSDGPCQVKLIKEWRGFCG